MSEHAPNGHPYDALTPDIILDAVESLGFVSNGRFLALNSYENRVYQVGLEEAQPVVVKFYRPGRWSDAAIHEEHAFSTALQEREIPVVAPWRDTAGQTLFEFAGFRFAVFPRRGGRWPDLENPENLEWLGRFLGQIHAVGASFRFEHRIQLNVASYGEAATAFLLERDFIPAQQRDAFARLYEELLDLLRRIYAEAGPLTEICLHGDCHPGNILWTEKGPHFVDFDDACRGPAIQDLWMLLSGDATHMRMQLSDILEGYDLFYEFDYRELRLIEALRTLRMLHYCAWLARRWDDPAFPLNFPWFNTMRYWEEQYAHLLEQRERLQEPPRVLP